MSRNFLLAPHVISVFRLQNLKLSILGSRLVRFHKKINRTWRHNQRELSSNKLLHIFQQFPLHSHSEGKHCTILRSFKSQCFDGTWLSSWWLSYVRKWLNEEGKFSFVLRSSCLLWCNLPLAIIQRHNSGTEVEIVTIFHIRSDPKFWIGDTHPQDYVHGGIQLRWLILVMYMYAHALHMVFICFFDPPLFPLCCLHLWCGQSKCKGSRFVFSWWWWLHHIVPS